MPNIVGLVSKGFRRACCRSAELCVWGFAKKVGSIVPAVSEYEPIASLCYYTGIHRHRGFQLLVEICAMNGDYLKNKIIVELVVGDSSVEMSPVPTSSKGCLEMVGSRGSIQVKQGHRSVELVVYRKFLVTRRKIGTVCFDIERDIVEQGFPTKKWYTLKDENRVIGRLQISFHLIPSPENMVDCLVLQQALLCAQDYNRSGKKVNTMIGNDKIMLQHEKLYLLSFALEGSLIAKDKYTSEMRYFRAVLQRSSWLWCYWGSKEDCRERRTPQGSIPILAISTVVRHPTDYTSFYVKHYTKHDTRDLILKAVDRNRDVWTDALYLFIEQTRSYLEHFQNFDALSSINMV